MLPRLLIFFILKTYFGRATHKLANDYCNELFDASTLKKLYDSTRGVNEMTSSLLLYFRDLPPGLIKLTVSPVKMLAAICRVTSKRVIVSFVTAT
jgi:hypothetical protein